MEVNIKHNTRQENAIGNGDIFPNQRARYVDIISTMTTVILDFHYKSWLPLCTTHPYSCFSTLPLYNRKAKELRLLLPVRGLALRNSPLINPLRWSDQTNLSLVQTMTLRLVGAKPLPEPMPEIVNWTPRMKHQWILYRHFYTSFKKMHLNMSSAE